MASTLPRNLLDVRLLPAALGIVYVAGFVVSNAHYGRFGPVSPSLLQVRYLGAGLLFLLFAGIAATAGWVVSERMLHPERFKYRRGDDVRPASRIELAAAVAITLVGALFGWFLLYLWLTGGEGEAMDLPVVFFAIYLATPTAIWLWHTDELILATWVVPMFVLVSTGLFGIFAYPNVRPEYGGGGAWQATIEVELSEGTRHTVAGVLVDRVDAGLVIRQCTGDPLTLTIPHEGVLSLRILEPRPAGRRQLC